MSRSHFGSSARRHELHLLAGGVVGVAPNPSVSPAETSPPGRGAIVWRAHANHVPQTVVWLCQGMALLCLCLLHQRGPLEAVWPLPRPLVHKGEAQRSNANLERCSHPVQVGQWITNCLGADETPTGGTWQRQGVDGGVPRPMVGAQLPSRQAHNPHLEQAHRASPTHSRP